MIRSLYLGSIAGTKIYIHWSFWILAIVIFLSNLSNGIDSALRIVGFIFAVFACVFLHELGHALTAKHFGLRTLDIILLPIGGVARIAASRFDAWVDGWIAIAGPAVNIALAGLLGVGIWLFGGETVSWTAFKDLNWAQQLLLANVGLALFNLLPVFPLDGGRVLRALFCYWMSPSTATNASARIGQWISGLWIIYALLQLDFLGVFFGVAIFLVNTFQRLKTRLIILGQGRPTGGGFSEEAWDPFGGAGRGGASPFDNPFDRRYERRYERGTIDAVEVREIDPDDLNSEPSDLESGGPDRSNGRGLPRS